MKRRDFLRHLAVHGCALLREGGIHFNKADFYFSKYSCKNSIVE
jgi:hypothetical protein